MPRSDDDIEQSGLPTIPPEEDIEEQEIPEPEPASTSVPIPDSKWNWIGSDSRPEAQETEDGISDLFEIDEDMTDTQDIVSVDIERDILDAGPEGDLADLVEVSEEDILGDEETGQIPLDYKPDAPKRKSLPRYRRTSTRYVPPISTRGMRG